MDLFKKYFICILLTSVFVGGLFSFSCRAQYYNLYSLSPFYSNFNNVSYINPYSGWGLNNPYLNILQYNNPIVSPLGFTGMPWELDFFGNNLLNQSLQGPSVMELITAYDYLNYAVNFYGIARQIPLLYLRDIQADQIGALLYSYADTQEVSLQDAIYYFIRQMYVQ